MKLFLLISFCLLFRFNSVVCDLITCDVVDWWYCRLCIYSAMFAIVLIAFQIKATSVHIRFVTHFAIGMCISDFICRLSGDVSLHVIEDSIMCILTAITGFFKHYTDYNSILYFLSKWTRSKS